LSSVDALTYALDQFEGTLIFISHDVYFIRTLANHVVHVNAGRLTHYPGGYQYYLDRTRAVSARAGLTADGGPGVSALPGRPDSPARASSPAADRKEQKRAAAEQRQARYRARKAQQERVDRLEQEIHELEARLADLVAELEQPGTYAKPGRPAAINRELSEARRRLAELNPAWEREATRLAELE